MCKSVGTGCHDAKSAAAGGFEIGKGQPAKLSPVKPRAIIRYGYSNPFPSNVSIQPNAFRILIAIAVKNGIVQSFAQSQFKKEPAAIQSLGLEEFAYLTTKDVHLRYIRRTDSVV